MGKKPLNQKTKDKWKKYLTEIFVNKSKLLIR